MGIKITILEFRTTELKLKCLLELDKFILHWLYIW